MKQKLIYSVVIIISIFVSIVIFVNHYQTINHSTPLIDEGMILSKNDVIATSSIQQRDKLYEVISVTDGDTIKVKINGTIDTLRLIGMDTPETVDPRKPVQCFAKEASNKAKETLENKSIRLEADMVSGERDKYDRLLRYVFLEDGTFYNKFMIMEGYAHEYTYQSQVYKYQTDFKEAEQDARKNSRGLWSINTCNGDTIQAVEVKTDLTSSTSMTAIQESTDQPQVKKSTNNICHEKGVSRYYNQTKNYVGFSSIEGCLTSGGRLPK